MMISMPSLLLILAIVILLFGTKKLKNLGSDLGGAFKGFKKALDDGESKEKNVEDKSDSDVIEGEVVEEKKSKKK
ncbi:MAG: twin-arginine translocase TatA/TatE family subunit [Gammaproteobacteria bacterium]|nr:twin-arginine translocase TatA/TatE family subunit [Gammaproteobacteria bacterium]MDH5630313.1 twin-arginine translocase TatA/TatE family subunit [Gammaproteobacteria bacterium]